MNMYNAANIDTPRSTFPHGNDCQVTFRRRCDNLGALIDLWRVLTGSRHQFFISMIKRVQKSNDAPWVFGSIYTDERMRREVWSFKRDAERLIPNFYGEMYTAASDNGVTETVFKSFLGAERRFLLSKVLRVPQMALALPSSPDVPELSEIAAKEKVPVEIPRMVTVPVAEVLQEALPPIVLKSLPLAGDSSYQMRWFVDNVLSNMCGGPNA